MLNKTTATQLIQSGGYLGNPPLFDIGDIVGYRESSFTALGFYPEPASRFSGQKFKIIRMHQIVLPFPVMAIAWEYEVSWHPASVKNAAYARHFVEPQIYLVN